MGRCSSCSCLISSSILDDIGTLMAILVFKDSLNLTVNLFFKNKWNGSFSLGFPGTHYTTSLPEEKYGTWKLLSGRQNFFRTYGGCLDYRNNITLLAHGLLLIREQKNGLDRRYWAIRGQGSGLHSSQFS